MTALQRIRKTQELLDKAEREGYCASTAVLEEISEDLAEAARLLAEVTRDLRTHGSSRDPEMAAYTRDVCGACSRLRTLFQGGEEYCNSLIGLLSVPRSGYTADGVPPLLQLHGGIAVEG
jgi:hypothetical protein